MTEARKIIFRLLGAQWVAICFVGVISFFVSVLIARTLGPNLFGTYTTAVSISAIASILVDGGFGKLIQREKTLPSLTIEHSTIVRFSFGHVILSATCLMALCFFIGQDEPVTLISALLFFSAIAFNQILMAILRGEGRLAREALWQMLNRLFTASGVVLVVVLGWNLPWHMLVAQLFGALAFAIVLSRGLELRPNFSLNWNIYKIVLPFLWLDLATMVYFRADMVLLAILKVPSSHVGQYGVAYRLIEAIMTVSGPIGLLLFRWFRQNTVDPSLISKRLLPSLTISLMVALFFFILLHFQAASLIKLSYGSRFQESSELISILCWGIIFIIPNSVLSQFLLATGKERHLALIATFVAIFNISGNLLLIPESGVKGAAWIMVFTELLLMLCLILFLLISTKNIKSIFK